MALAGGKEAGLYLGPPPLAIKKKRKKKKSVGVLTFYLFRFVF